jgi:ribosomal protein L37AE/L43A
MTKKNSECDYCKKKIVKSKLKKIWIIIKKKRL